MVLTSSKCRMSEEVGLCAAHHLLNTSIQDCSSSRPCSQAVGPGCYGERGQSIYHIMTMPGMIYEESPEEPHLVSRVVTVQIFLVTSDISSELLSCANELRVRACRSKLALAIYGNRPDLWHLKFWP